jgi:hypothetical protein
VAVLAVLHSLVLHGNWEHLHMVLHGDCFPLNPSPQKSHKLTFLCLRVKHQSIILVSSILAIDFYYDYRGENTGVF